MARFIYAALIIGIISFYQSYFGLNIFGIKINLALAGIIAASFFLKDIPETIFLIALSSFALKFSPQAEEGIIIFSSVLLGAVLIRKFLPWHNAINNVFLVFLSTLAFYLIGAYKLILSAVF